MKDLLLFARPPQPKLAVVDIGALVTTTANLLRGDPAFERVHQGGRRTGTCGGGRRTPEDRVCEPPGECRARHAGTWNNPRIGGLGRRPLPDCLYRRGRAFPPRHLEKIFTPFLTTKARGSGPGPPTVRRLIDAHHGTISIACPSTGGTVVTVQLPGERLTVVM
jgi:hypothetical protein